MKLSKMEKRIVEKIRETGKITNDLVSKRNKLFHAFWKEDVYNEHFHRMLTLATPAKEVCFTEDDELVAEMLLDYMQRSPYRIATGNPYGISAPQVGVGTRIFACKLDAEEVEVISGRTADVDGSGKIRTAFLNPVIMSESMPEEFSETCLSVNPLGKFSTLIRSTEVVFQAHCFVTGEQVQLRARNLAARVLQHEMDHLDGILYTDRAKEYRQMRKKLAFA